jgi:hypothetical protein
MARRRSTTDPEQTLADTFGPGTGLTAPNWAADLVNLLLAPGAGPLTDPVTVVDEQTLGTSPLLPST